MENQNTLFEKYVALKKSMDDLKSGRLNDIEAAIPSDVAVRLFEIEEGHRADMKVVQDQFKQVEKWLKKIVLDGSATIKSPEHELQVVFSNGRVTWDNKLMEHYAKENKEVLAFRKIGKDSASIKKLKVDEE